MAARPSPGSAAINLTVVEMEAAERLLKAVLDDREIDPFEGRDDLRAAAVRLRSKITVAKATGIAKSPFSAR